MSVSLEQHDYILVKTWISSSREEDILTASQRLNTPPETNEESRSEDSYVSDDKQTSKQEIKEDEEELQQDLSEENHAYESYIEQWFQAVETYFKFFNLNTKAFLFRVSDFQEA